MPISHLLLSRSTRGRIDDFQAGAPSSPDAFDDVIDASDMAAISISTAGNIIQGQLKWLQIVVLHIVPGT